MLTQKYLKECLDYNPETGVFTWKERPLSHFSERKRWLAWLSNFSGKTAGGKHCMGYWTICINNKPYLAHRLAWLYVFGSMPKDQIDHINWDRLDNRIANLREVSNQENHKNKPAQKNNTSGVVGVCWDKSREKWCARIKVSGKTVNLGRFDKKSQAIIARKSAETIYGFHKNYGRAAQC